MLKVIILATLTAAVAQGTPLLLTALGEILTQRSRRSESGTGGNDVDGSSFCFYCIDSYR